MPTGPNPFSDQKTKSHRSSVSFQVHTAHWYQTQDQNLVQCLLQKKRKKELLASEIQLGLRYQLHNFFQPALPNSPYLEISKNVKYIVSLLRETLRHLLPDTSKGIPASYQIFELVNDIEKNQISFWTMLVNIPTIQSDFIELRMTEKSNVNIKYMLVKNYTMDYSRSRFKLFFFSFSFGNHAHKPAAG